MYFTFLDGCGLGGLTNMLCVRFEFFFLLQICVGRQKIRPKRWFEMVAYYSPLCSSVFSLFCPVPSNKEAQGGNGRTFVLFYSSPPLI
jgi:hypothetical protein